MHHFALVLFIEDYKSILLINNNASKSNPYRTLINTRNSIKKSCTQQVWELIIFTKYKKEFY